MRPILRFRDEHTGASAASLRALAPGKRLDVSTLAAYLCQDAPSPPSRTLYEGVTNDVLLGAFRTGPDPLLLDAAPPRDAREAAARVGALLERVVERAVGSAGRVAVLASGGIDSSSLLAMTLEIMRRRGGSAFAIAIDFASPGDDRPHLRALETYLGVEVVRIAPEDGARHLEPLRNGIDAAPMLWPYSPLQLALFEVARRHGAELVLTGVGGDDFFDGDPRALATLARRHPLRAVAEARALDGFDTPRSPVLEWIVRPSLVPLLPRTIRRARAERRPQPHATAAWAGPRLREAARRAQERSLEEALAPRPATSAAVDFGAPGARYFAWLVHQEQHAVGLDRVDPLYTEEVGEALASIPPEMLLAGGRRRGLLREAMRGRLPDTLLDRSDKAEFAPAFPPFYAAAGGSRAFAEELEGRCLARLEIVDGSAFGREIRRALEAPSQDGSYGLAWAALAAEAFLVRHSDLVP